MDQVFDQLAEAGYHCPYTPDYSETLAYAVAYNLETAASRVICDQLSAAIPTYWVHLRRNTQSECGVEESIGGLFSSIAGIVAGLIFNAVPDRGELVGPAEASAEEVSA